MCCSILQLGVLHFYFGYLFTVLTCSDCPCLKLFCKCTWFADMNLRNLALLLGVLLALFTEFTESLYLNSFL